MFMYISSLFNDALLVAEVIQRRFVKMGARHRRTWKAWGGRKCGILQGTIPAFVYSDGRKSWKSQPTSKPVHLPDMTEALHPVSNSSVTSVSRRNLNWKPKTKETSWDKMMVLTWILKRRLKEEYVWDQRFSRRWRLSRVGGTRDWYCVF